MSWLDRLFTKGYTQIQINGIAVPSENILNFVAGASAADNQSNARTDITFTAASFAAAGDLTGSNTSQQVVALTGSGGIVQVRGTAALQFGSATTTTAGYVRTPKLPGAGVGVDIVTARNYNDSLNLGVLGLWDDAGKDAMYLGGGPFGTITLCGIDLTTTLVAAYLTTSYDYVFQVDANGTTLGPATSTGTHLNFGNACSQDASAKIRVYPGNPTGYSVVSSRNQALTANFNVVGVFKSGTQDAVWVGDAGATGCGAELDITSSGYDFYMTSSHPLSVQATKVVVGPDLAAGLPLAFGSAPATAGTIRLPNNSSVYALSQNGLTNLQLLGLDSANNATFANTGVVAYHFGSTIIMQNASAEIARFNSTGMNLANGFAGLTIGNTNGIIGSGTNVLALVNGTAPSSNPSGGCFLYATAGRPIYRDSSGNVVTVGANRIVAVEQYADGGTWNTAVTTTSSGSFVNSAETITLATSLAVGDILVVHGRIATSVDAGCVNQTQVVVSENSGAVNTAKAETFFENGSGFLIYPFSFRHVITAAGTCTIVVQTRKTAGTGNVYVATRGSITVQIVRP